MCIDHIFDAVGDEVAGGKGIKHAVMSHSYAVVDSDRVEFGGKASWFLDFFFYRLPYFMQMYMAGNELGERIDDCDDGVSHLRFFHAVGSP